MRKTEEYTDTITERVFEGEGITLQSINNPRIGHAQMLDFSLTFDPKIHNIDRDCLEDVIINEIERQSML